MLEVAVFIYLRHYKNSNFPLGFKPKVYGRKFIFRFASYDPNGPTEHS